MHQHTFCLLWLEYAEDVVGDICLWSLGLRLGGIDSAQYIPSLAASVQASSTRCMADTGRDKMRKATPAAQP